VKKREWLLLAVSIPRPSDSPRFLIKTNQINPSGWKIKNEKSPRGENKRSGILLLEFPLYIARIWRVWYF
jgi:hypothetical protein